MSVWTAFKMSVWYRSILCLPVFFFVCQSTLFVKQYILCLPVFSLSGQPSLHTPFHQFDSPDNPTFLDWMHHTHYTIPYTTTTRILLFYTIMKWLLKWLSYTITRKCCSFIHLQQVFIINIVPGIQLIEQKNQNFYHMNNLNLTHLWSDITGLLRELRCCYVRWTVTFTFSDKNNAIVDEVFDIYVYIYWRWCVVIRRGGALRHGSGAFGLWAFDGRLPVPTEVA